MRNTSARLSALLLIAASSLDAADMRPEFEMERRSLGERLAVLSRFLPDSPADSEHVLGQLRSLAMTSRLDGRDIRAGAPITTDTEVYIPVDMTFEGGYMPIHGFFDKLARLPRIVVVHRVTLTRESSGRLRCESALRLPYWRAPAFLPPVLERRFPGVPASDLEAFHRELAVYRAKIAMIETHGRPNPLRLLSVFDGGRVRLDEVSLGREFHLRGRRVIPGARFDPDLRAIGADVTWSDRTSEGEPRGKCESFVIRGATRMRGSDEDAELATDRSWLFSDDDPCRAQPPAPEAGVKPEPTGRKPLMLSFGDGTTISFELIRSGGETSPSLDSSAVMTGKGVGHRILVDPKRRFFGYSVKALKVDEGQYRVLVGPLTADARRNIEADFGKLMGDPMDIEYPEPQVVRAGEPLLLELMVNRVTGEKLSDLIQVRAAPPARPPDPLKIAEAVLKIDGEARVTNPQTVSGRYLHIALRDRGRFVISLEPVAGYGFEAAELVEDRIIRFASGGHLYEWVSKEPVIQVPSAPGRLWVWHDRDYRIKDTHEAGAFDALPTR